MPSSVIILTIVLVLVVVSTAFVVADGNSNNDFCGNVASILTVASRSSSKLQATTTTTAAASPATTTGTGALLENFDAAGVAARLGEVLDGSSAGSGGNGNNMVTLQLSPLLFSALSQSSNLAVRDIVGRAQNNQHFGGGSSGWGTSKSTTYKFFTTMAAVARTKDASNWPQSFWDNLMNKAFSGARADKPWILDVDGIRSNLTAAPFSFPTVWTLTGASIQDLKDNLAMGNLVSVAYQSQWHYSSCASTQSTLPSLAWPTLQSRTMLSIVAGVDSNNVYLIDGCSHEARYIPIPEFMMRWHACEIVGGTNVCSSGRVVYVSVNSAPTANGGGGGQQPQPTSNDARTLTNDVQGVDDLRNAKRG